MQSYNSAAFENLLNAVARLDDADDCRAFLEDLCTIKELRDMAQRFETARLLNAGKNYSEIAAEAGVSTATISRVNRCLCYGSGGYAKALGLADKTEKNA